MKLEIVITQDAHPNFATFMSAWHFASCILRNVANEILEIKDANRRPAEFYVETPRFSVQAVNDTRTEMLPIGVELRLTGVSRNGRKAKQFHVALNMLHNCAKEQLQDVLESIGNYQRKVQLFTVLMLDGDVETSPGSGVYSNMLEHPAEWITAERTENPTTEKTHGI